MGIGEAGRNWRGPWVTAPRSPPPRPGAP